MEMLVPLRSTLLSRHGFDHGFSPRAGGVSRGAFESLNLGRASADDEAAVAENHRRMAAAVGYDAERLFETSQVHGSEVHVVATGAHARASDIQASGAQTTDVQVVRARAADALVALPSELAADDAKPIAIGVRTADCVPLLIAHPASGAVAAVHAGWRGMAGGVITAAVQCLGQRVGAAPDALVVAVFPHIRACCFEVGAEVVAPLTAALSQRAQAAAVVARSPRPHIDLSVVARDQLRALGVPDPSIDDVPGCTRCEPERFFSYRRQGQASGRHLTVIVPKRSTGRRTSTDPAP